MDVVAGVGEHAGVGVDCKHLDGVCVTAGITTGFTVENTYADVNIQDKRLSYFNTNEMQIEQTSPLAKIGETFLKQASAGIWGYDNQQNIQPSTTYMVNDAFIDRLHTK